MNSGKSQDATLLLAELGRGDESAAARLFPMVYDELRAIASGYLKRQRASHTLQPTALVHEAYLRLVDQSGVQWKDRAHFFALAAKAMRHILVDHARRRGAVKRGGEGERLALDAAEIAADENEIDLVALDEALVSLAALDERQSRIVELRFFGGLSNPEVAEVLGVSLRTVEGEWSMARGWLRGKLSVD